MIGPAFHRDAYAAELETEVVDVGQDNDRKWVVTADTVFYPEGGGQPADHGLMGEGCIPLMQIRGWIEEAGFKGFNEGINPVSMRATI